jgi:hypothetical protein
MNYLLLPQTTLGQLRSEFRAHFPALRLEFVCRSGDAAHSSSTSGRFPDQTRMVDLDPDFFPVSVRISAALSVSQLERLFLEKFALQVQVYRCAGAFWIHVTESANESLRDQELRGGQAEFHPKPLTTDPLPANARPL